MTDQQRRDAGGGFGHAGNIDHCIGMHRHAMTVVRIAETVLIQILFQSSGKNCRTIDYAIADFAFENFLNRIHLIFPFEFS